MHPADRPRFAQLGVIANFEPLWAQLDEVMLELTMPRLGPTLSALQYPIASLARSGARLSFGSDWPVTDADPLAGLAVAVTRRTPVETQQVGGCPRSGSDPRCRARLHGGTAHQAFDEPERGTLAIGARADLTLLDTDITSVAGNEVADAAVRGLWLDGEEIWSS